jgi:succinate dehydrogenase flavin-adding protein (antitoxin of CptAB toxin-antitoxin module)
MGYVSGYSTPEGTKRYWGNGDGRFIYPPEAAAGAASGPGKSGPEPVIEPPASSIRWEMLREGIEDWEYLYLLRQLLGTRRAKLTDEQVKHYEALLEVPDAVTKDMTTFTTDPAPIYARRAEVAEAIEQLLGKSE